MFRSTWKELTEALFCPEVEENQFQKILNMYLIQEKLFFLSKL